MHTRPSVHWDIRGRGRLALLGHAGEGSGSHHRCGLAPNPSLDRSSDADWYQTAKMSGRLVRSGAGAEGAVDVSGGQDTEDAAVQVEQEVLARWAGADRPDQVLPTDGSREPESVLEGACDGGRRHPRSSVDGYGQERGLIDHAHRRTGR